MTFFPNFSRVPRQSSSKQPDGRAQLDGSWQLLFRAWGLIPRKTGDAAGVTTIAVLSSFLRAFPCGCVVNGADMPGMQRAVAARRQIHIAELTAVLPRRHMARVAKQDFFFFLLRRAGFRSHECSWPISGHLLKKMGAQTVGRADGNVKFMSFSTPGLIWHWCHGIHTCN